VKLLDDDPQLRTEVRYHCVNHGRRKPGGYCTCNDWSMCTETERILLGRVNSVGTCLDSTHGIAVCCECCGRSAVTQAIVNGMLSTRLPSPARAPWCT
jgi:hypothetical protein